MVFISGVCDGNAAAASAEYHRRYPNRRNPNHKTIQRTFNTLWETGSLLSVRLHSEHDPEHQSVEEENILDAVQRSPRASTRCLALCCGVPQSMVWRTLNENRLHPYHLQKVQHLQPGDPAHRLDFCNWLNENRHLYHYILASDKAQFTRHGINTHNSHVWAELNPHPAMESNFQHRFSINLWCGVLHDQLIGPFVFLGLLTGAVYLQFLQELLQLLGDVSLAARYRMVFQHDEAVCTHGLLDHQTFPC
jgi:hypothetical protein